MNAVRLLGSASALFVSLSAVGQSADRFDVRIYQTEDFVELPPPQVTFQCCPMVNEHDPYNLQVALSVELPDPLKEGDILLVFGELLGEQKNVEGTIGSILFASGIYLGNGPSYVESENINKYQICEGGGQNLAFAADIVKQTQVRVGTYRKLDSTLEPDRRYINFYAYGGSSHSLNEMWALEANSRLTVVRFTRGVVPTPYHGYEIIVPHADNNANIGTVTSTSAMNPDVIYRNQSRRP